MDLQTALSSIGQSFKVAGFSDGVIGKFDTIRTVKQDGTIVGDFTEAYCVDCRLKQEQPEHLKKVN